MKQNVMLLIVGLSVFTVANVYGQKVDYGDTCVGKSSVPGEQCNEVKFFVCSTVEATKQGTCQCMPNYYKKAAEAKTDACAPKLALNGDCSADNGACKDDFTCTAGVCKANAGIACTTKDNCAVPNSACVTSTCETCGTGKVPNTDGTACVAAPAGTCGTKTCEADEECKENKCVKKNGSDVLQGPGFILLLVSLIVGTLASRG